MDKQKRPTPLKVQYYREAAGLTRTELSRQLREQGFVITPRRIRGIEEDTACVRTNDLFAFARFFRIRVSDLFYE